jgi:hypothetical protein
MQESCDDFIPTLEHRVHKRNHNITTADDTRDELLRQYRINNRVQTVLRAQFGKIGNALCGYSAAQVKPVITLFATKGMAAFLMPGFWLPVLVLIAGIWLSLLPLKEDH